MPVASFTDTGARVMPRIEAVVWVVPATTPVTCPLELTVATAVLLRAHVMGLR